MRHRVKIDATLELARLTADRKDAQIAALTTETALLRMMANQLEYCLSLIDRATKTALTSDIRTQRERELSEILEIELINTSEILLGEPEKGTVLDAKLFEPLRPTPPAVPSKTPSRIREGD